jgi:hypothetical protein
VRPRLGRVFTEDEDRTGDMARAASQ